MTKYINFSRGIIDTWKQFSWLFCALQLFTSLSFLLSVFLGRKSYLSFLLSIWFFILLISNSVQNAMVGDNTTLWGGVIAALTLFLVNYLFKNIFSNRKKSVSLFRTVLLMLVYHGKVVEKHMKEAKLSRDELDAAIREHGVEDIADVDLAVLEVDGNISVLSDQFRKITIRHRHAHKVIQKNT